MKFPILSLIVAVSISSLVPATGQSIPRRQDDPIAPQVESMYTKGLRYLAGSQSPDGSWPDRTGTEPGVVGLCVMAFLAHGEDPNFGPYAKNIRNGLVRSLVGGFTQAMGLTGAHELGHVAGCGHDTEWGRSIMNVASGAGLDFEWADWIPAHAKIIEKRVGRAPLR